MLFTRARRCHQLWKEYAKELETRLDSFLAERKVTSQQMHESLARMQRIDPNVLMSYDYLLAGIDYAEFQYMMLDYKVSAWVKCATVCCRLLCLENETLWALCALI